MWGTLAGLGNDAIKWLGTGDNATGLLKGLGTIGIGVGGYLNGNEQNKMAKQMLDLQTQNYNYELEKEKKRQKSWDDAVQNVYGAPKLNLGA